MGQNRTDNLRVNAPKLVDSRYFKDSISTPYASKQEAFDLILYKVKKLCFAVMINGVERECWFRDGVSSVNNIVPTDEGVAGTNIEVFGAKGDGITNNLAAFTTAFDSGLKLYIPDGSFKIVGTVPHTGSVYITGNGVSSKILCDTNVFDIINGGNSVIDNLWFENITVPWTITRDFSNINAVPSVVQSNNGYQPTVNDTDVWSTLTTSQQNQSIGPTIYMHGVASNISISRIYGRFVTVYINDASNSKVFSGDFKGGKSPFGGIVFNNLYNPGVKNQTSNNKVSFASDCGICFVRNNQASSINDECFNNGESGIKTYQNTIAGIDAKCYDVQIINPNCHHNFYDGLDLQSDFNEHTTTVESNHRVLGGQSFMNAGCGLIIDGKDNLISSFKAMLNGRDGIRAYTSKSKFADIEVRDNNSANQPTGVSDFVFDNTGTDNEVDGLSIRRTNGFTYYGFYNTSSGVFRNISLNGTGYINSNASALIHNLITGSDMVIRANGIVQIPATISEDTGFRVGNGDGASYTSYNTIWKAWNGVALMDFTGAIKGVIDFRNGIIDLNGGFMVNGRAVPVISELSTYDEALVIASASGANNNMSLDFWSRPGILSKTSKIVSQLIYGAGGAEKANLYFQTIVNGTMKTGLTISGVSDNLIVRIATPNIGVNPAWIDASETVITLDETKNQIWFRTKFTDSTWKDVKLPFGLSDITDVTTEDATDAATAVTLANANKAKINELLALFRDSSEL